MSRVGHHSPEARAVQTFMRAFDGWCRAGLGAGATLVLAHQGVEDWLRARLAKSHWETVTFAGLVSLAIERNLIDEREASRLTRLHQASRRVRATGRGPAGPNLAALLFWLIEFIERRW
jgi:hypothetical protein